MSEVLGIVGAGPFGLALAKVVADTGKTVVLLSTTPSVVEQVREERRCDRLPSVQLSGNILITSEAQIIAEQCRFIILAVAPADVRNRARQLSKHLNGNHLLVHAVGALTENATRFSQVLEAETPVVRLGVLAGPALPKDLVAQNSRGSSIVCGSLYHEVVMEARRLLSALPVLRVYTSMDLLGVELAAALSGAYTVALGLADGLGIGSGTRGVLLTRALAEATRLGVRVGADSRTFLGLAGLGNFLVRSSGSAREPDYELGLAIAKGAPFTLARCAGANAAAAVVKLAQKVGESLPVLEAVAGVVTKELTPTDAMRVISDRTVALEEV